MTSPHFNFINASARKLFHSRIETVSIDHNAKVCMLKPFLLQTNQETGKTYRKYLRVHIKGVGTIPYIRLKTTLPSEKLLKDYEGKRQKFSDDLNTDISEQLEAHRNKILKKKPLTERQQEWLNLWKLGIDIKEIAKKMEISLPVCYEYKNAVQKKGILLENPYF